ncbi:hypothetical protein ABW19_dt0206823 [Dactylella cylindrospora]|nr:hypothetical protein ABW19_dt0206823 [Dactylella cylindrospora]
MLGVAGGVAPKVRLGDIVVGCPSGRYPGVVQWDLGKATDEGLERTGALNNPPTGLMAAVNSMEGDYKDGWSKICDYLEELKRKNPVLASRYLRAEKLQDNRFRSDYLHVTKKPEGANDSNEDDCCEYCDRTQLEPREPRDQKVSKGPVVHYGLIASGNQVIKNAKLRDELYERMDKEVLCVEMEAAGLLHEYPCLVIRGICDYADSHKNDQWQGYAAAVAAAYAKDLLSRIPLSAAEGESPVGRALQTEYLLPNDILSASDTGSIEYSEPNENRYGGSLESRDSIDDSQGYGRSRVYRRLLATDASASKLSMGLVREIFGIHRRDRKKDDKVGR